MLRINEVMIFPAKFAEDINVNRQTVKFDGVWYPVDCGYWIDICQHFGKCHLRLVA